MAQGIHIINLGGCTVRVSNQGVALLGAGGLNGLSAYFLDAVGHGEGNQGIHGVVAVIIENHDGVVTGSQLAEGILGAVTAVDILPGDGSAAEIVRGSHDAGVQAQPGVGLVAGGSVADFLIDGEAFSCHHHRGSGMLGFGIHSHDADALALLDGIVSSHQDHIILAHGQTLQFFVASIGSSREDIVSLPGFPCLAVVAAIDIVPVVGCGGAGVCVLGINADPVALHSGRCRDQHAFALLKCGLVDAHACLFSSMGMGHGRNQSHSQYHHQRQKQADDALECHFRKFPFHVLYLRSNPFRFAYPVKCAKRYAWH